MSLILIADDQRDVLEALRILLKSEGHQTDAVTSLAGIFSALAKKDYALLIMDLNYTRDTTSGQEGLAAIPKIQEIDNTLPIVVMTAWASIDLAVEAMKRGARDFVTKPWDNERLLTIVRTQIELAVALRRGRKLEAENQLLRGSLPNLIADSPAMQPVIEMISRVAPSDANVLITGENGTGKGLFAQALHTLSPRASRTMITVNMGGLSETLFESELFGHVKGAFTDAKTDRAGRVSVGPFLNVDGASGVFVVGDASAVESNGRPVPGVAQAAIQQGHYVGRLIARQLRGREPKHRFRYFDKGNMAVVGKNFAILESGRLRMSGFVTWLVWVFLHLMSLPQLQNRMRVQTEWLLAYYTGQRSSRLIPEAPRPEQEPGN